MQRLEKPGRANKALAKLAPVAVPVRLRYRQVVGVQVNADGSEGAIDHRHLEPPSQIPDPVWKDWLGMAG